ncbi:kinesin light chain, putative [Talaromyces stipitatus ATCC 10500]|uniref:Kinesin light chain, putative n=1 Tax=Talaromyces stipitatus (strain ATCC 10500 / CBS 375.48 / QM 6759 / NRRL 1006) TaxID=441959 RepID=B8MPR7_TALSN|nr:kinesin light chain, putative [Talaromyces stipitatus ATCC 10500]EED12703.1 kinesin light chain, putative [Talaromyces stipitatus ATCC 10500]
MTSLTHNDYTIAWICALPLEVAAACVMLDKMHSGLPQPFNDSNAYQLGELNGHYIVIACLPAGVYGTVSAATVISRMRSTFPRLQYGLMVGIGGGIPSKNNDILLGDIVVSKPVGKYGSVIQYDYGKAIQSGQFEPTGTLNKPPQVLLTHMSQMEAKQTTGGENDILKIVEDVLERNPDINERFSSPEQHMDLLFHPSYHHVTGEDTCEDCDKEQLIKRHPRETRTPYIHYGLITSGDKVVKDSETRDRLAQQHGILCFEMEAAGLMDKLPTLVIRGICDYCNSHKQKQWQGYAALAAAAYAKLLLSVIPNNRTDMDLMKCKKMQQWMVSLDRNPRFVGREDELTKLEEFITLNDGPRRIAITGLGGVGKTQVALELAYRIRDRDTECSIFWIPCTSYAMIEQAFLHIAQILGPPDVDPAEVKERIQTYLSTEIAGKWLLIFDNADDTEMWLAGNNTSALEDFLPQSEHGHILFTTRNGELAVDLTYSNMIHMPDVDRKAACDILESLLSQKSLLDDHSMTANLLEQLAFLPIAIAQASAYINKKRLSLLEYVTLLQEQEQDAVELLSEDFRDPGRYKDIQNPVITTWLISFKQIQHHDQLAADYLSFMACINPRNIPQSLLPQPTSRKQKTDALGLLNAYSFISGRDLDISMHRLVRMATRNWLRKNALFSHWIQQVAEQMQRVFPDNHHTKRGLWREYLPHALALVHKNEFVVQENNYLDLTGKVANCLASDGRYQEAEHTSTLTSMANLASTYRNQGRWKEAEKLEVQVMETSKTVLGAEHPSTLTGMANLASTYRNQGRWNEAEKLEVQVMETSKTVLGAEHPDTLTGMANLASTFWNQGRWNEAEKLDVQVMETSKTVLGAEHPDTLTSMANLAYTWKSQGKMQDALTLMKQCSYQRNKVLGPSHPDSMSSFRALNNWMDEYNALIDKAPLTGNSCLQPLREVAAGSRAAVQTTQSTRGAHINLPYAPAVKSFLGNHPLIIAARTPSPRAEGQDIQDVD